MRYTADQLGHEDARFTMRCYTQASKRRDRMAKAQAEAFDRALQWADMAGVSVDSLGTNRDLHANAGNTSALKKPRFRGFF
jgi:hypothetical protein